MSFSLVLLLFAFLLALGTNPYLIPGFYDNALYYSLGRSLSEGGPYVFMGNLIVDWPPLYPWILAGVFKLFGDSILTAKVATACIAIAGLSAAFSLLKRENRPVPNLNVLLMALLPVGLSMGLRIAPEWLFILLSFSFLYLVESMRQSRSLFLALMAGILLGAASLTRYIGVILGSALIAQSFLIYREKGKIDILPECATAGTGACVFLSWIAWIHFFYDGQVQTGNYEKFGLSIFSDFSLNAIVLSVSDLFFQGINIGQTFTLGSAILLGFSYLIFLLIAVGFVQQIRSRPKASDFYALATILLLSCFQWKLSRYLLPIFPFLFSYLVEGGSLIFSRSQLLAVSLCWLLLIAGIDVHLLYKGNRSDFHGLSLFASPTPSDFYKGEWREVYEAAKEIPKGDSEVIGVHPSLLKYVKYIHAWTGREVILDREENPKQFVYYIRTP